jgi:NTP pyrophosphatase (non-canonical NTP hydrolase)
MPTTELLKKAIITWGVESQLDQAVEEFCELITAILHHKRGRASNIAEECADASIMLDQIKIMVGDNLVEQFKHQKLQRLAVRLESVQ